MFTHVVCGTYGRGYVLPEGVLTPTPHDSIGSILFWRIALRLEVWGYTNKTRLRGFQRVRAGGLRLCSRDFQSPGVSSKSGCSRLNFRGYALSHSVTTKAIGNESISCI
ncbi:MAG: hypothetical protein V7L23_08360 [Nostoc sp.]|uniref:hypothetical protein n=1 Tax=Nostoc sp. TaxID=1180 RepID=UPI002FF3675B